MEAEIDTWRSFYPAVQGIFFDEQSNLAVDADYYRTLSQFAKAHGLSFTVGNPGTDTAEAFVGALDTMLIYESKGLPDLARLGGWHAKYAPANFGIIPYGATLDPAYVAAARKLVGYVYVQNDDLPNPWDTLPPFFSDLLAALE
jgi:Spherulation-specific family 4